MALFKKGKVPMDERMVSITNAIYKEAYYLAVILCTISIGVKFQ